jgi:hypothetical protein
MLLGLGGGGDVPKRAKEERRKGGKWGLYSPRMRLCEVNLADARP